MSQDSTTDKKTVWDTWSARGYLDQYFKQFGSDVKLTTAFITKELKSFKTEELPRVLDFGCGPTIIGIIGTAPYAREIHVADYLDSNLEEIQKWSRNTPDHFDFTNAISYTLELEGLESTPLNLQERSIDLRKKITKVMHGDAGSKHPLGAEDSRYPLVISLYCADSSTGSKQTWQQYMSNILGLLAPSGTLLMAALRKCEFYAIGSHRFPSANIDEKDMAASLFENGFTPENVSIQVVNAPDGETKGFTELLFVRAQKSAV